MSYNEEIILEHKFELLKKEIVSYVRNTVSEIAQSKIEELVKLAVERRVSSVLDLPLTVKQVSMLTGHSEQSIYKMCQRDKIPYHKNGGTLHINIREINDMLLSK